MISIQRNEIAYCLKNFAKIYRLSHITKVYQRSSVANWILNGIIQSSRVPTKLALVILISNQQSINFFYYIFFFKMNEKENEMLESWKYFYDNFAKISDSLASFFKFIYLFLSLLLAFIYVFLFKICDFCKFISIY